MNVCASSPRLDELQAVNNHFAREKTDINHLAEIEDFKASKNHYFHKDYETFLNLPPDPLQNGQKEGIAIFKNLFDNLLHTGGKKVDKSQGEAQCAHSWFLDFCGQIDLPKF